MSSCPNSQLENGSCAPFIHDVFPRQFLDLTGIRILTLKSRVKVTCFWILILPDIFRLEGNLRSLVDDLHKRQLVLQQPEDQCHVYQTSTRKGLFLNLFQVTMSLTDLMLWKMNSGDLKNKMNLIGFVFSCLFSIPAQSRCGGGRDDPRTFQSNRHEPRWRHISRRAARISR